MLLCKFQFSQRNISKQVFKLNIYHMRCYKLKNCVNAFTVAR